jgi:hypothetical protein
MRMSIIAAIGRSASFSRFFVGEFDICVLGACSESARSQFRRFSSTATANKIVAGSTRFGG